jgi:rod shape-determining protein MreD
LALRRIGFWIVIAILAALVEATWPNALRFQGVIPDLVLILVVYCAITEGEERAMYMGLIGGLFQDVNTNTVLGLHVICLVIVAFVVGRVAKRLITDNPAVKAVAVFLSSVVHSLIYALIDYVQNTDTQVLFTMLVGVLPRAFYTALLTPILFLLVSRVIRVDTREGLVA